MTAKLRFAPLAAALVLLASSAVRAWPGGRPKWTKAKPHFEAREGRRVAVAVGKAKDRNPALARVAAEERARADLLRLLQRKPAGASAEGAVAGAVVAEVFSAKGGTTYVRLEATVPGEPAAAP